VIWRTNPKEYLNYYQTVEAELNQRFPLFIKSSPVLQAGVPAFITQDISKKLNDDPELIGKLIPD
jgi:hypothetical protein